MNFAIRHKIFGKFGPIEEKKQLLLVNFSQLANFDFEILQGKMCASWRSSSSCKFFAGAAGEMDCKRHISALLIPADGNLRPLEAELLGDARLAAPFLKSLGLDAGAACAWQWNLSSPW